MGKCITCGKNADSDYCFQHKPRKALAKVSSITYKKTNIVQNNEHVLEMKEFFISIWKRRKHYSEVSGQYLGAEPMSTYFHHILPKEKYPEARLDEENIILLSLEEHSNVENDMYKYEEINQRRLYLRNKYDL